MKIAVFFTNSHTAAWSLTLGLTDTLKRMGHEVLAGPLVPGAKSVSKSSVPSFDELTTADAVLVSGPEYLTPYLKALYPDWGKLEVPKAAWYHESNHREDKEFHFEKVMPFYDFNFFPAPQDAEELKGEFLPFGVDTAMFSPRKAGLPMAWSELEKAVKSVRDIDLAFIGLMYDKRVEFFKKLPKDIRDRLRIGNCLVQDLDGINIRKSAELYADTLRRTKVFVMMPALSQLVVTKVYEVKACGAYLLEPDAEIDADPSGVAGRECARTLVNDALDKRLDVMLTKMGCGVAV